jgi:hypothetical protein
MNWKKVKSGENYKKNEHDKKGKKMAAHFC